MPETQQHRAHEKTDVRPSLIGLFALGLVLMIAVVLPLLGWVFWRFEAAARRADRPQSQLSDNQVSAGPKLQARPAADLASLRRNENLRLSSYGWIDQKQGVVHVPIELAIAILAKRGLPEPTGPASVAEDQEHKPR